MLDHWSLFLCHTKKILILISITATPVSPSCQEVRTRAILIDRGEALFILIGAISADCTYDADCRIDAKNKKYPIMFCECFYEERTHFFRHLWGLGKVSKAVYSVKFVFKSIQPCFFTGMEFMIGSNFLDYVFESPNQLIIQIIVLSCPFESVKLMASVFKENILMYQNLIWYKIQYNHNDDRMA